ncbi:hypothetical protein [Acidithiobacillus ferrooxidans]|nr:hypothetical protein [Acidithiobacillus ferrooxidans]
MGVFEAGWTMDAEARLYRPLARLRYCAHHYLTAKEIADAVV